MNKKLVKLTIACLAAIIETLVYVRTVPASYKLKMQDSLDDLKEAAK